MAISFVQNFMMRFQRPETLARKSAAQSLYNAVAKAARQPRLYVDYNIPDSFDGRFDCLVLFASLILRRLKQLEGESSPLGREFATLFISDMDRTVRELGVGDLGVGKHVKVMAEAFYGRLKSYDEALSRKEGLADALQRNLLGSLSGKILADACKRLPELESYILILVKRLSEMDQGQFMSGAIDMLALLTERNGE